jgi:hypothetical protein
MRVLYSLRAAPVMYSKPHRKTAARFPMHYEDLSKMEEERQ